MKKTSTYKIISIVVTHLFLSIALVSFSVGFDFQKVNLLQVFYALVVGSPLLLSFLVYYSFVRLTRSISSCVLIIFLKFLVFVILVSIMIFLNYVFSSFFEGEIITENIGKLLILFLIVFGTLFISFKDGKICVF